MRAFQSDKTADCGFNSDGIKNSLFKQLLRHKPDSGAQGVWGRHPHRKKKFFKKEQGALPHKKTRKKFVPKENPLEGLCGFPHNEGGRGFLHEKESF